MKTSTFLTLILLATVTFTGCKKDSTTDIRDAFVATYSVTETWTENSKTLTKPAFTMSVEKSSQHTDMVLLNNFANYGAGITAEATISGKNLTIPQQTLPNLKAIIGSGTLSETTLTFTYTESYNNISINISATAKKK
ncbi:MAG: hypothetical protein NTV31_11455 [Bacteroidia bacterium]|nr:hypothetical protein [Bacteroidia bacterium]